MAGIGQVLNKNNISERPNVLDKLYFIENGQSEAKLNNKKLIDYLWMNSMYFMNNLLVEAYVYENGYSTLILDILNSINLKYEFVRIKDFKYELNW